MMNEFHRYHGTGVMALHKRLKQIIRNIVDAERSGRWVAASVGLAHLREQYETFDQNDLPANERSWQAFAAKHVPIPEARVNELIGKMVHFGDLIHCSACNAASKSVCGCGAHYVGQHRWARAAKKASALDRAMAAIKLNPEKSNRAIAAEIGVSFETVRAARRHAITVNPDLSVDLSVDGDGRDQLTNQLTNRLGRDGKRRKLPGTHIQIDADLTQETHEDAVTPRQQWEWSLMAAAGDAVAMRAYWKRQFGDWRKFTPPSRAVMMARQAAREWEALVNDLERYKR